MIWNILCLTRLKQNKAKQKCLTKDVTQQLLTKEIIFEKRKQVFISRTMGKRTRGNLGNHPGLGVQQRLTQSSSGKEIVVGCFPQTLPKVLSGFCSIFQIKHYCIPQDCFSWFQDTITAYFINQIINLQCIIKISQQYRSLTMLFLRIS